MYGILRSPGEKLLVSHDLTDPFSSDAEASFVSLQIRIDAVTSSSCDYETTENAM